MPRTVLQERPPIALDLAARRRRSLLINLVVLLAGAAALLCFIAVLADARRAGNAMRQAAIQAEHYTERMQGTGVLPLNLEPFVPEGGDSRLVAFEAIPMEHAVALRNRRGPVLVAWSAPVLRVFGPDGRAVVRFDQGRFQAEWMSEEVFLARRAAQAHLVSDGE